MKYQENRIFTLNEPHAPRLNPALACEIGLNESLLLLQIEFFISVCGIEKDGQKWIFNSTRDMQSKWFPFWSHHTINRALKSLESSGYIETTTHYNKVKYDKTRWFALNFDGLSNLNSIAIKVSNDGGETRSTQNETGSEQNETTIQETLKRDSKTNVLNHETTPAAPLDPKQEQKPVRSLFSSENVEKLIQTVPEDQRTTDIEKRLKKALVNGVAVAYLLDAIAYTTDKRPENYLVSAEFLFLPIFKAFKWISAP